MDVQRVHTGFQRSEMRIYAVVDNRREHARRRPAEAGAGRIKQIVFGQSRGKNFRLHAAQMFQRFAVDRDIGASSEIRVYAELN